MLLSGTNPAVLSYFTDPIDKLLPSPYSSLIKGITYGVSLSANKELYLQILRSGASHVVVLSGSNITLLLRLTERIGSHFGKTTSIVFNIGFILSFIFLVGLQPPLWRAFCSFFLESICIYTRRPSYQLWNLFLTIFFTSIIFPRWMYSVSFHLSVAATLGIIISQHIIDAYSSKPNPILQTFFESCVVSLCTLPISWYVFGSFTPISSITTILISWLILPLMIFGFLIPLSYICFPFIAHVIAIPALGASSLFVTIISLCSRIPWGHIQIK